MRRSKKEPSSEALASLRSQIQDWRRTRRIPEAMPIGIWEQAICLAKEFGVCRIARAVGLDYTALRKRTENVLTTGLVKPTFIQMPEALVTSEPALPALPGATIEITAADGARLRIQLEAGRGMEAAGIVAACLGSRP
jgi:hypothetical protein